MLSTLVRQKGFVSGFQMRNPDLSKCSQIRSQGVQVPNTLYSEPKLREKQTACQTTSVTRKI